MAESDEKPRHSPGPWRWSCGTSGQLVDANGVEVIVGAEDDSGFLVPDTADARLIASAPTLLRQRDELLAALKQRHGPVELPGHCHYCDLIARIEAEIAQERAQPGGEVDRG